MINAKHNSALIIATEDNENRISSRIKKQLTKIDPEEMEAIIQVPMEILEILALKSEQQFLLIFRI